MELHLNVQGSPHIRDSASTRKIMLDVIIALLPASLWGILRFGTNSAIVIVTTIVACLLSESIFNFIIKKSNTIDDLSAVVTGLILALNMPPEIPIYIPIIGAVFSIVIVKMLFGGLGQNFMNPALAGRCFVLISFTGQMNNFTSRMSVDAYTSATPLALLKNNAPVNLMDQFLGFTPGTIGEISTLCLLIGAAYLLVKKVISLDIPLTYILSFIIFLFIFSGRATDMNYILGELLGGGLIFGAFFMANDYTTSPITPFGKIIYAIFLGILTGIFRVFGKTPECVSYCILMGNILVPLIESLTIPTAFGKEGK